MLTLWWNGPTGYRQLKHTGQSLKEENYISEEQKTVNSTSVAILVIYPSQEELFTKFSS
jgi:hypothetical protein